MTAGTDPPDANRLPAVAVVNAPVFGVVPPIGVLLIVPPVIATPDIVPVVIWEPTTVGFG